LRNLNKKYKGIAIRILFANSHSKGKMDEELYIFIAISIIIEATTKLPILLNALFDFEFI
tara:strand:- start:341 stop:520 length:180 start_codon:yes stop_codon:yes gene_type:complete